jgi:hypothetical protein
MVVLPRSEIKRTQIGGVLTCILGVVVLAGTLANFAGASELVQVGMILLVIVALAAMALSVLGALSHRRNSKAVLFQEDDNFIVATNHLHEGYKLRFFRDILNEKIVSMTDAEREHWKVIEQFGFHAVFNVQHVRKPVLLPLCFMVFDEVFLVDHTRRWDYFNSQNTSEPTFSDRGVGPFDLDGVLPESKK